MTTEELFREDACRGHRAARVVSSVRTMAVKPHRGQGRVRLGEIEGLDLQACGGTHARSTGEIGQVEVARIEKKGASIGGWWSSSWIDAQARV